MGMPSKQREYPNRFFDSTVWNDFAFRDDDVVIASYAKAGTTWVQQIVAQLIFGGAEEIEVSRLSPWFDSVYPDKATKQRLLAEQRHRRFVKTHLPADALVLSERARYLYVGRDARDIVWSLYDHQQAVSADAQARLDAEPSSNGKLKVMPPPMCSVEDYFQTWMRADGAPLWPFWEGVRSWRVLRDYDNVLLVHYAALLHDLPAQVRRIAAFLEIPLDAQCCERVLAHCSLDYMRAHAARYVPQGAGFWRDGGQAFFNQGLNGRWRDRLAPAVDAAYRQRVVAELGAECAHWLATGDVSSAAHATTGMVA
ncbi:sulfotransferase domain-containing protein [Xanthomonas arboricola pv. corylina]|uniref:sulfotransferase domain-containing protein n=1 Tax=Xanthomonas arboricola TaxID=56448 RepID=UPI000CEDBEDC|nr:sulfotransferase domain-containing protein [Xanthomonas arboricola]MDN0203851.1 sulfotransferase domain-containing protein [Xanthomonas arboricola pv. corylina]MDN0215423.1 sulfotransferase domain-containing protein [Xanthomonas arboricola pv. corylina]PPU62178.1 sulfotransferase [Xanthomonas arboricola pv. corylina]